MVLQLILIQIITFIVILVVLRLLFGSQLRVALSRLQDLQHESLEKEEILNKEIERARAQSQSELARSKEEARIILENAKKASGRVAQEGVEQAQVQARKILNDAAEQAKQIEASVTAEAAAKAVALAEELIVRILTERGRAAFHAELVKEFLDEFAKVDKERLKTPCQKVEIISVEPLVASVRGKLEELLREKIGHEIAIHEKADPALLMGVMLEMGGLVVDGSLRNKLRKAMDALRQR
jgi:F-type H+-transporting ATPase subunit b